MELVCVPNGHTPALARARASLVPSQDLMNFFDPECRSTPHRVAQNGLDQDANGIFRPFSS